MKQIVAHASLGLLAGGLGLGCSTERATPSRSSFPVVASPERASLVLVTLDTFRADASGCGGSPDAHTPHLDRIARTGVQFETGLTTSPLTLPAHASMLTGLNPPAHGARSNGTFRVSEDVPTLAEALSRRGLASGAFLAAFALDGKFGLDRGFDVYDDAVGGGAGRATFEMAQRSGDLVVESALAWLDTVPRDARRFEWVHLFDAHQPYVAPRALVRACAGDPYLAAASLADAHLGARLRASEIRGETPWVIVFGDHGEARGDHAEDTHGLFLYGATMNVPALLWPAPKELSPGLLRATLRSVDLAATAFDLLGFDPDTAPGNGRSALRESGGPAFMETLYPFLHFGWSKLEAVRDGRWKYVNAPEPELYDLVEDPGELHNVWSEHPERREEMARILVTLKSAERREAVELDEESRLALESLGYLTRVVEEPEEGARPDPKRMVRVNQLLGSAMEAFGRGEEETARRLLATALSIDPKNKEIHRTMGIMHSASGRYQIAIDWLQRSLALPGDERDPFPHAELARCYLRLNRPTEAIEHLEIVLELDPDDPTAWNNLGVARHRLGDLERAREAWRRALEIDPDLETAREWMGR